MTKTVDFIFKSAIVALIHTLSNIALRAISNDDDEIGHGPTKLDTLLM